MTRIIHFTTVHPRTDVRIRVKQVATLAKQWPEQVALYVQDGLGNEHDAQDAFKIYDIGPRPKGRLRRMTLGTFRMYRAIVRARPQIAHFHDPELLPWAMLLHFHRIKVIYDMHEDLPNQLLHKDYLPVAIFRALSLVMEKMELIAARMFAGIIVVVPAMQARFKSENPLLLANFPSLLEFPPLSKQKLNRTPGRFIYVGGIEGVRGISEMTDAISLVEDVRASLRLLGTFAYDHLEQQTRARSGWRRVVFLGWCGRTTVIEELSKASAGLVLLHPTPQYVISYPVKMFEYMAAGLPVIASDFPLWREIVESSGCGLLVDPLDPQAIASAMQWILDNPEEADAMGRRGRVAVEACYNWEAESHKLVTFYRRLMAKI